MHCYLIVLREDDLANSDESPRDISFVEKLFEHSYFFVEGAWIVVTEIATCGDVLKKLQIENGGERSNWSAVAVKMNDYNGFAERSLWEKIAEWVDS